MALADRGLDRRYTRGPRCLVAQLYARIPEQDADTLRDWLDDAAVPTVSIWRALVAEGLEPPTKEVIGRHRRGDCACGRRVG